MVVILRLRWLPILRCSWWWEWVRVSWWSMIRGTEGARQKLAGEERVSLEDSRGTRNLARHGGTRSALGRHWCSVFKARWIMACLTTANPANNLLQIIHLIAEVTASRQMMEAVFCSVANHWASLLPQNLARPRNALTPLVRSRE